VIAAILNRDNHAKIDVVVSTTADVYSSLFFNSIALYAAGQ